MIITKNWLNEFLDVSELSIDTIAKTLNSAIANAEHNEGADIDELWVSVAMIDEGPTLKRFRARAKGRGTRILKRTSHITIVVSDDPKPAKAK